MPGHPDSTEQVLGQLHWRYATKRFDPNRKIDLTSVALCAVGYRAAEDRFAALPKVRFPKDRVIIHL